MNDSSAHYSLKSTIIITMLANYLSCTKLLVHSSEINKNTNNNHAFSLAIISFGQIESYKDIKLIIRTRELAI